MKHHRAAVEVADAVQMLARKDRPVSRDTVYRLIKSGDLEAYRLGDSRNSKYYVYEDSIEALKERRAIAPEYDKERIKKLLAA